MGSRPQSEKVNSEGLGRRIPRPSTGLGSSWRKLPVCDAVLDAEVVRMSMKGSQGYLGLFRLATAQSRDWWRSLVSFGKLLRTRVGGANGS